MSFFSDADPAFPCTRYSNGEQEQYSGMSRADYFAAHAPAEIPTWFTDDAFEELHPKPSEPKSYDEYRDLGDNIRKTMMEWHRGPSYDLPDSLLWFQQEWSEYWETLRKWGIAREVNRYFAWRRYYGYISTEPDQLQKATAVWLK